jgi:hypothetical protein
VHDIMPAWVRHSFTHRSLKRSDLIQEWSAMLDEAETVTARWWRDRERLLDDVLLAEPLAKGNNPSDGGER